MWKRIKIYVDEFERNYKTDRFEKLKSFFIDAKKREEKTLLMSASILLKDLFNKRTFETVYKLKNNDELKTFNLLNTDSTKHIFIDEKFAQEVCEKLQITFQQLLKFKLIREFDDRSKVTVTHVIYFIMTVNRHRKNLISLLITKLRNHKLILKRLWMKRHDIILNMINDFFIFWFDHCDHFDVYIHENKNEMNVDSNTQTNVKSQTNFEKISFISLSISIRKRKTFSSSFSSIENEKKEKIKNSSKKKKKMKKKMIRISKVKQNKRTSKNASSKVFRSKDCFASSDITFVDVVVYNLLSKQKKCETFRHFF